MSEIKNTADKLVGKGEIHILLGGQVLTGEIEAVAGDLVTFKPDPSPWGAVKRVYFATNALVLLGK